MIQSNPNGLVERYLSELDRMMVHHRSPVLEVDFVDYSSARLLLERAIQEAFNQGATFGLALAKPAKIELKVCDSHPDSAGLLLDLIHGQGGGVTA